MSNIISTITSTITSTSNSSTGGGSSTAITTITSTVSNTNTAGIAGDTSGQLDCLSVGFRRINIYMNVMYKIITQEFFDFFIIISIMVLAFAGSFSLALRLNGMPHTSETTEAGYVYRVSFSVLK